MGMDPEKHAPVNIVNELLEARNGHLIWMRACMHACRQAGRQAGMQASMQACTRANWGKCHVHNETLHMDMCMY